MIRFLKWCIHFMVKTSLFLSLNFIHGVMANLEMIKTLMEKCGSTPITQNSQQKHSNSYIWYFTFRPHYTDFYTCILKVKMSPRSRRHVAKFYSWVLFIRSSLRTSTFSISFTGNYTIPLVSLYFGIIWLHIQIFFQFFICLRITDDYPISETLVRSIL